MSNKMMLTLWTPPKPVLYSIQYHTVPPKPPACTKLKKITIYLLQQGMPGSDGKPGFPGIAGHPGDVVKLS